MYREISRQLFSFIEKCPTACHTADTSAAMLKKAGYTELFEEELWTLRPGGKYYVVRGMSSLIAFQLPKSDYRSFLIVAPHGDAPGFKVKENPEMRTAGAYARLNTEVYGGIELNLWQDRPLSVAGRVLVRTEDGVEARLVNLERDLLIIPSLAIHLKPQINDGMKMNPQIDSIPLYGSESADLVKLIAQELSVSSGDILSHDLFLYCRQKGGFFGEEEDFIFSPKLDDLQSVFSALTAFLAAENEAHVPVLSIFDNEEIGSMTKQGAHSTFLADVLSRISLGCGKNEQETAASVAASFILSADNGHAAHPNHPEKADPTNLCYPNKGVVIKHNSKYATDGISAAVFKYICEMADIPTQSYFKRSDERGGSTLGNIIGTHVSSHIADIGLAQLAMHSPCESGGAKDTKYMADALKAFYCSSITLTDGGRRFKINSKPSESQKSLWQDISSSSRAFKGN